jgi:site-specific DNA-methyltransferase (adenine-specific)
LLDEQSGVRQSGVRQSGVRKGMGFHGASGDGGPAIEGSSGGASRFFYVAKAARAERDAGLAHLPPRTGGEATDRKDGSDGLNSPRAGAGRRGGARNTHPTVKPIELMRYLVRLVTPPGGLVLDPFAGSGTTGIAALREGARFVGVDLEPEYARLAIARIEEDAPLFNRRRGE